MQTHRHDTNAKVDTCVADAGMRTGMTLVEMLAATAITLIMMAAIAQLFSTLGQGVNGTRSLTELDDRMRAVAFRLRYDLEGTTAPVSVTPPLRPDSNAGYFEYIEGPFDDKSSIVPYVSGPDNRLLGDVDDVLLFTTRSPAEYFSGRSGGGPIQSPLAEVIWYCRKTANTEDPELYTLYRRHRLVMAHPGVAPFITPAAPNTAPFTTWSALHAVTDIACRLQNGLAVPATLGDLTKRENRFCRAELFPYEFLLDKTDSDGSSILTFEAAHPRFGEDVVLTNVIAFDVRVFDMAPCRSAGPHLLFPDDIGFNSTASLPNGPNGSDWWISLEPVNLGWEGGITLAVGSPFPPSGGVLGELGFRTRGLNVRSSSTNNTLQAATYCTWSTHYETNGIDEDGDGSIDQGQDGQDSDMDGEIDEADEAETSPPYPVPLSGIEIRIRCYEPSSRQVRQVTIRHSFVPH